MRTRRFVGRIPGNCAACVPFGSSRRQQSSELCEMVETQDDASRAPQQIGGALLHQIAQAIRKPLVAE